MTQYTTKDAQNLELIRQKCIEANPEIVAEEQIAIAYIWTTKGEWVESVPLQVGNIPNELDCPFCKGLTSGKCGVHGTAIAKRSAMRPIRLADVLLAFGERVHNDDRIDDLIKGTTYSWNLRKDNLNEQSEQTINFLASLL
jgi:hypothetical protein